MGSGHKFKVAICGGGIGGLTTAVALSMYPNIEVDVYEGATRFAEIGAGIGIFPRPWEVIKRLGLDQELLKLTEVKLREGPVLAFRYRKSDQRKGLDFYTLKTNGNLLTFHRADFQQVLLRRLPKSCRTHCSKRLRSYTQRHSGPIELLFEDGSKTTCDMLVGADGLKSAVRRSFLGEKAQWAKSEGRLAEVADIKASVDAVWSGTNAYRALIPADRLRARVPDHRVLSCPTQYLGKNGYIIAYPIAHGKTINLVAFITRHELENTTFNGPWVSTVDKSEITATFSDWEPEVQELLNCIEQPLRWAVHTVRPLKSFVSGRVVLIGDAAHAMTPHQGSGAGQAIEDAHLLATLLGHPRTTRESIGRALHIFDHIRRPIALDVVERSRSNGQMFSFHGYNFDRLPEGEMVKELRSLSKIFTKAWEWTWTTSIDESVREALRLLES